MTRQSKKPAKDDQLKGKDTAVSKDFGPYHTHMCAWCRGDIMCVNGPDCDVGDLEMHCTTACYMHKGDEGRAEGNRTGD